MSYKKPRLLILGNAPLRENLSEFIDTSDIVLRFNDAFYYGFNTGRKVDILCITNTGSSSLSIATNREILRKKINEKVSEIWFPRDSDYHKKYIIENHIDYTLNEFDDYSHEIISSNHLNDKIIKKFSKEFNKTVFNKVITYNPSYFICPSTGIMALEYIISDERFSEFEKILVGFTFEGWKGHAWSEEQKIINSYMENRKDFKFLPTKPFKYNLTKKIVKAKTKITARLKKW
ncbi:hypothetical protein MASR1M68_05110 [Elusimicrobiota bacterium]